MPSRNTYHLFGFLLPWACSIFSQLLQQSTATAPYLDEGYLLTAAVADLQCWIAPLGPPVPAQPLLLPGFGHGWLLPTATPVLGVGVAPQGHRPWPQAQGGFSRPPLTSDVGCLLPAATGLGRWVMCFQLSQ